jgi:hypothetical protein
MQLAVAIHTSNNHEVSLRTFVRFSATQRAMRMKTLMLTYYGIDNFLRVICMKKYATIGLILLCHMLIILQNPTSPASFH